MYTVYTKDPLTESSFSVADTETSDGPRMINPELRLERNRGGLFEFDVFDDHTKLYKNLKLINDRILIVNNNNTIFCGRPIQESYDWYNKRHVVCEGVLAFLSDVVIPYVSSFSSANEYVKYLIDFYNNSKSKDTRSIVKTKFVINDESFPSEGTSKSIKDLTSNGDRYRTVYELLTEFLDYVDWTVNVVYSRAFADQFTLQFVSTPTYTHPVPVKFSDNLLDIGKENDMADFATVFYPLGRPKNESVSKKTIDDYRGKRIKTKKSTYIKRQVILSDGSVRSNHRGGSKNKLIRYTAFLNYIEDYTTIYIRGTTYIGNAYFVFVDSSGNPISHALRPSSEVADRGQNTGYIMMGLPPNTAALYIAYHETNKSIPLEDGAWIDASTPGGGTVKESLANYERQEVEPINYAYINDTGIIVQDIADKLYKTVTISLDGTNYSKLLLSTKCREGYGLYSFLDSYGHVLSIRMSDSTPALTYLKDEVVEVPEGAQTFNIGYYGSEYDVGLYKYKDPSSNVESHVGNDLMVTQVENVSTIFGHLDSTDGHIVDYTQTYVSGARADSVVYAGLKVRVGKKYLYSGMNRLGHGVIRIRGSSDSAPIYLHTVGSSDVETNLQNFEFTVPGTDESKTYICDLGGILGNARTHLWEYVEDNDDLKANYITIESENDGVPYLTDDDLIEQYGWIEKVHTFDDIESPSMLMEKGLNYFRDIKKQVDYSYTAKAIDPSILSDDYRTYIPGDYVTVISSPHGVSDIVMEVKSADIHLNAPQNNTYDLVYENSDESEDE